MKIITSHNMPATELMEGGIEWNVLSRGLTAGSVKKQKYDFHGLFPDWHERMLLAGIRRDRNHPVSYVEYWE